MKYQTLFAVALAGCSFPPGELRDPPLDRDAPRVDIESPARGTIAGNVTKVLVTGMASDANGVVASVTVNGVPAIIGADGRWAADVPVVAGTSLLRAIAIDDEGNRGESTRAVVAGPMVDLDRHVDEGIRATLSSPALLTLAHSTATLIENGDLLSYAQSINPVVAVDGGPDCLYAHASITSLTVGDADVLTAPTNGGIMVSAVLENVDIGMHLQWSVACLDGGRDVVVSADRLTLQGLIAVGVVDRKLDIQFARSNVQVTGFDPQLPAVPDSVVRMLQLDAAVSPLMGSMVGRLVVSITSQALDALDDTRTVSFGRIDVDVDVAPKQISFTTRGGSVALDTSVRARNDKGQFVFVENIAPTLAMEQGFELAIADDAANQLLTSLWSRKAFDETVELNGDAVKLQLMLPPHVRASSLPLELTIGDWIATLPNATVAIHATTSLYVTKNDTSKLQLAVSTPAVRVDVVDGALTKEQLATIKQFAIDHVTEVGSAAVAALPLPTVGNAVPANLWVEPKSDSMLIVGDLEEGGL